MKKTALIVIALATSFCCGFAFNAMITKHSGNKTKRVTGIGGIFFKSKEPGKLKQWYQTHLGLHINQYGTVFEWYQGADSTKKGFLQWSPFKESTSYFQPSQKEFMINYRVENIKELVQNLQQEGVTITDTIASYSYGKFVHIMDIEGNKLELWEPNDGEYEKLGIKMGAETTK